MKRSTESVASPAAWTANDLAANPSRWIFPLDDTARTAVAQAVKAAYVPDKPLFAYRRDDFDFGPAGAVLDAAFCEVRDGLGIALVRGLPRADMSEPAFELMNWAIGLHRGVARPQGKASQYLSAVRDAGTDYRSASGRGYSSNASLDFHVDGADEVTLGCYNKAKSGGQTMVASAVTVHNILVAERPDLAEVAYRDFHFSRQGEEAPDETPFYGQPIFDEENGLLFNKWNRNRVQSAQRFEGVPRLSPEQRETMDMLDAILRRPDVMVSMYLEPGDLQILNSHVTSHSRTDYVDHDDPTRKRLLCRLWLAPPDSVRLPASWGAFYRSIEPGSVRGGIRGHRHDQACRDFERRQAAEHGMRAG
jgi:hypothetical protein